MTKICILAGNLLEAKRFAFSQEWDESQWFYPYDENDLNKRSNFHVLVIGSAGHNVPISYFDKIYETAKTRGRIGRGNDD